MIKKTLLQNHKIVKDDYIKSLDSTKTLNKLNENVSDLIIEENISNAIKIALITFLHDSSLDYNWLVYHLDKIGFDGIFVIDNNNSDNKFNLTLNNVTVFPYNNIDLTSDKSKKIEVFKLYSNIVSSMGYDFACVLDTDEYIVLENRYKTIKSLVANTVCVGGYDCAVLSIDNYSDNNIIWERDIKCNSIIDCYTSISKNVNSDIRYIFKIKDANGYTENLNPVFDSKNINYLPKDNAKLNKYPTLCLESYFNNKVLKNHTEDNGLISYFFDVNDVTKEKIEAFKGLLYSNNIHIYDDVLKMYEKSISIKTAVMCIQKDEDKFIDEWIDYHLGIGADHIFIIDNNTNKKRFTTKNKNVTIFPYNDIKLKDRKHIQAKAYNYFIPIIYEMGYDYLAIVDVDEFITFNGYESISDYIKKEMIPNGINMSELRWVIYDDNDIIWEKDTKKSVIETYTRVQTKYTDFSHIWGPINVTPSNYLSFSKPLFKLTEESKMLNEHWLTDETYYSHHHENVNKACIRHYMVKCLETYIKTKVIKQNSNKQNLNDIRQNIVHWYFYTNVITQQKINAFKKLLKKYKLDSYEKILSNLEEKFKQNGSKDLLKGNDILLGTK